MTALQLPPPVASTADQADVVRVVTELGELADCLGKHAVEGGIELSALPVTNGGDLLAEEALLRRHCVDAIQRIEDAKGPREAEQQTAHGLDLQRELMPMVKARTITEKALYTIGARRREEAYAALAREQEPSGPLVVVENLTEAARRRTRGENVVHSSDAPRVEKTLTQICLETFARQHAGVGA